MPFSARLRAVAFTSAYLCFVLLIAACSSEKKRVVFFGDSVTQAGAESGGYIELMKTMVDTSRYELIGAGIGGNKVPDLQDRLQADVLALNPDIVYIYIGINDVWHFYQFDDVTGTEADVYEAGLIDLAEQIKSTGASVVFCTPTVIGEDVNSDSEENTHLAQYADIVRSVAEETGSPLCDLRTAFSTYLVANNPDKAFEGTLTTDGVHMNDAGNQFLAEQMKDCLP